jgi:hypothetical protein
MKGDVVASNADFKAAKEIKPSTVDEFAKISAHSTPKSAF